MRSAKYLSLPCVISADTAKRGRKFLKIERKIRMTELPTTSTSRGALGDQKEFQFSDTMVTLSEICASASPVM